MAEQTEAFTPPVGPRVTLCSDGKYRWVYDMSLLKNPTVFLLIWKIFFFVLAGIFAFLLVADAVSWGGFDARRTLETLKMFGWFVLGMTALVGVSYLIYAAVMGWRYVVEFEMDDRGLVHRQVASQARKARKLGLAAAAVGLAAGQSSALLTGMNAGGAELTTEFGKVRRIRPCPRRDLIRVDAPLSHNQVYARPEDFAFVLEFITARCGNLRTK